MVTKEQVKEGLNNALSILAYMAQWTPTKIDDGFVAALAVLASKEWFLEALTYVLNFYTPPSKDGESKPEEGKKSVEEFLRDILLSHK